MRREGFIKIFWGLLFIVLDIRIDSVDLFLPDFIGYILIVKGLNLLAPEHSAFSKARIFAVIMIFVSIPSLIELGTKSNDPSFLKRQLISVVTGDLSALLPEQVNSAKLLRATNSQGIIDANRTQNPQRDADKVLGEYSDGTVVLILRYASPEDALRAMKQKSETDYSFETIRKRAETDESFRAENMSMPHGESGSNDRKLSAYSNIEAADRMIQQWWNRGWSWWNPLDMHGKGGWGGRMLYIVEGYKSSADTYKSVFEGESRNRAAITFNPLFPISIIGEVLDAILIWQICSGIIALSLSSNNYDLMNIANRRRIFYMVLTVTSWALWATWFIAPELMSGLVSPSGAGVLVIYVLVGISSVLLIMGLMRRAANSLQTESIPR